MAVTLPPFQSLLDAHGTELHRFLLATAGPGAAEDCLQETWISALRAYPRLRDASNLRAWLFTIARRKVIDHARAARRETMPGELPEAPAPEAPAPDDGLWAQVRTLPDKQRTALALRYILDAGYPEIAAAMGTSQDAARRSVHEGLKRLRKDLTDGSR
jgi:RNA polymerase sigma factor (sigma-70 family)